MSPENAESSVLSPLEEPKMLAQKHARFVIGIPKEQDSQENRVALTPDAVSILVKNDVEVWVEKNAGTKANFLDSDYMLAGGRIVESHDEIFSADCIVKINPLNPSELDAIRAGATLISALHAGQNEEEYLKKIIAKKITHLAFEYLEDHIGDHTIVRAMSEIAGSAVLLIATEYLSSVHAGKGIVLGGITGVPPTQVLILGAGTVAEYAARSAMGLGASIKIFDSQLYRLKRIQYILGHNTYTGLIDEKNLLAAFKEADVVIGAMRGTELAEGFKIPEEWISAMKQNSVIIDVSIDQGGCFETSKMTSHYSPVYKHHGVIHYCVPNIASRFAHTASLALSNILFPTLLKVVREGGIDELIYKYQWLMHGLITYKGNMTNQAIAKKYNLKYKDLGLLSAGFN
jgi:alanine dehydrogenase